MVSNRWLININILRWRQGLSKREAKGANASFQIFAESYVFITLK